MAWSGKEAASRPARPRADRPTSTERRVGADYKGQFRLGNREYCYPLTATDLLSRFLLACEALDSTDEELARAVFEDVFASTACRRDSH